MAKITVTGLAQWAKVFKDNRDLDGYQGAYHDTNGRCTIEMILDQENMQKLTDSGCMSRGKPDPEGRGTAVKLTRKFETAYEWDGGAPGWPVGPIGWRVGWWCRRLVCVADRMERGLVVLPGGL